MVGLAMLTAHDATGHVHLIIGSNPLASSRCTKSIEAGARPIVVAPKEAPMHYSLTSRIEEGKVEWIQRDFEDNDLSSLGRPEVDGYVDAVFVTLGGKNTLSKHISSLCRRLRIPVNVADSTNLSSFTILSTHTDGPLQIGITTSGKGCKLASRLKREVAASLPPNLGAGIERLGAMRRRIWEEDHRQFDLADTGEQSDDDEGGQKSDFNRLVLDSDHQATKLRRMRWLSQICEYWPLRRLATISDADIDGVLEAYSAVNQKPPASLQSSKGGSDGAQTSRPMIILAGSGPGHPDLLTIATRRAIETASVILADKLVPAPVLDLIPRRTPVHIARKFPGNAEAAQEELLTLGLEALQKGLTVLRLKQGDPYVYGRGGEEYTFFRAHGYTPVVLPGITSALSAPLFAAITPTHRAVADQILICTGTGRKGAPCKPPPHIPGQTVVFLMALHRLAALVDSLVAAPAADSKTSGVGVGAAAQLNSAPWPADTPCAVIERASCPDQRVIRSTLGHVVAAVEEEGSRPPGLLVVGEACEVLRSRDGNRWVVEEGFVGLEALDGLGMGAENALGGLKELERGVRV